MYYKSQTPERHSDSKIADEQSTKKRNVNLIDALIDSCQSGDITVDGIREKVQTFVFEGQETTSSGSALYLNILGICKELQKRDG